MKNTIVRKNEYFDSVTLMSLSSKILGVEGVVEAVVSMATDMNKELLQNVGLSTEESDKAENNDLLIAVEATDEDSYDEALKLIEELLKPKNKKKSKGEVQEPKTIDEALDQMEDANIALISVPGQFAGREAKKALENGLHVMLFSDNVSLEQEKELKEEEKILQEVKKVKKPVVVCFLDGIKEEKKEIEATFVYSLFDAAKSAVELAGVKAKENIHANLDGKLKEAKGRLKPEQKYVRALFGGGTLCAEALSVLRGSLPGIKSNVAKKEEEKLENIDEYSGNVLLDLGEDEFTVGRPHPMIEPTLRLDHILKQARDKTVGVILLDFELGFGSHEDPVGSTIETIKKAKKIANDDGRELIVVSYICGTDIDKQNYDSQRKMLEDEGVLIAESNIEAANMVAEILA